MRRNPSPYLEPVKRGDDLVAFGEHLEAFRARHALSWRDLEKICGGASVVSNSTLHRIAHGQTTRATTAKLQPVILDKLREYLRGKRLTKTQIAGELNHLCVPVSPHEEDEVISYDGLSTWGARLEAFRKQHRLSYHQLHGVCGGSAVTTQNTLMRVCICPGARVYKEEKLKADLTIHLRRFLEGRGRTPEQSETEVRQIFGDQEDDMYAPRTILPPEVQRHFGLRRDPFTGDPRTRAEVFTTPQLDRVVAAVEDAINYQGFLVVTGEIGSGKTILKRRIIESVEKSGGRLNLFWPEFFNMDRVHSGSIVSYLLTRFHQTVPGDLVNRAAKLKDVLADASAKGTRVALGFDECHHLHDRLLTALKNFWEFGSGGYDRYLGVVLFGQPQFEGRLRDHRFREICERIEVARMPSFEKVAGDYIAHRVKLAGGDAERLFDRDAIKRLAKQASTPLALGNLANAALLKAFTLGERKVLAEFLQSDDGEPQVRAVRRAS